LPFENQEFLFLFENIIFELLVANKCFLKKLEINQKSAQQTQNSYIECNFCKSENVSSMCGNCGTTYCSKNCQFQDWSQNNHHLKCVEKKNLLK
jgi:hypothetical protein